ncbi:MAG: aminotransferase class I/II-fold pyridoxal phosphate-dependent enzyme [Alphaproteobacteria bacterium]
MSTESHSHRYFPANRSYGTTPMMAAMVAEMTAAGVSVIDMGQGAEKKAPNGGLEKLLTVTTGPNVAYNSEICSPKVTRESAKGFVSRYLGIESGAAFVPRQLGRTELAEVFQMAGRSHVGQPHVPKVLTPTLSWPLIDSLADQCGLQHEHYDITADNIVAEVDKVVRSLNPDEIAAFYSNSIHNATGRLFTVEENKALKNYFDDLNSQRAADKQILLIYDNPYFASLPRNQDSSSHLDSGYQGVLMAESTSPWVHLVSLSKAFAQAQTGLTIVAADNVAGKTLEKRYSLNGHATAYEPERMANMAVVWGPEYDNHILKHTDALRENYEANRGLTEKVFGDRVMPGRASMTSLIQFSPDEIYSRAMECNDGNTREINDGIDLVEWLLNTHHVAVVYNGQDKEGNELLRIAQAQPGETFKEGLRRFEQGMRELRHAPRLSQDNDMDNNGYMDQMAAELPHDANLQPV